MPGADGTDAETDQALFERFKCKDEEATRELYRRWVPRLEILVRKLLGHRAHLQTADALQEVFLQLFLKADRFDGRSEPYTWAYQVATNWCVSHIRTLIRRERITGVIQPLSEEEVTAVAGSWLDEQLDAKLNVDLLRRLAEKDPLLLAFVTRKHGLSVKEVADVLQRPLPQVQAILKHAKETLRRHPELAHLARDWKDGGQDD